MSLTITHPFHSVIADDPSSLAAGEVTPSRWNAGHTISGTLPAANVGAAGSDTQVQFNTAGALGASSTLLWGGFELTSTAFIARTDLGGGTGYISVNDGVSDYLSTMSTPFGWFGVGSTTNMALSAKHTMQFFTDDNPTSVLDISHAGGVVSVLPITIGSVSTGVSFTPTGSNSVNINGELRVVDNGAIPALFGVSHATVTDRAFASDSPGDSFNRFSIDTNGLMRWGPGNVSQDNSLFRSGPLSMGFDGDLSCSGTLSIQGASPKIDCPGTTGAIEISNGGVGPALRCFGFGSTLYLTFGINATNTAGEVSAFNTSSPFVAPLNLNPFGGIINVGPAGLNITTADGAISELIAGASKGVRFVPSSSGVAIEGVDNTGLASYQPIKINGLSLLFQGSGSLVADYNSTTASTWTFAQKIAVPGGATPVLTTTSTVTSGAGALVGTLTNSPATGNPTKWIPFNDNGTTRYIPAW